jgi:hypothetical protein
VFPQGFQYFSISQAAGIMKSHVKGNALANEAFDCASGMFIFFDEDYLSALSGEEGSGGQTADPASYDN